MKRARNIALAGILFAALLLSSCAKDTSTAKQHTKIVRFPEIALKKNERIIEASMTFQTAHIKSIKNIPVEWDTEIDLAVPPNPIFKGSIIVGAAALGSAKELPEFEIENYLQEVEPKALSAEFVVTEYPGDLANVRKVQVNLSQP